MLMTKLKLAVGILALGALVTQTWAQAPQNPSEPGKKSAPDIAPDQFDKLRALIKPKAGGFDDLPWMTDLHEARKKAAAEGKPLLVWVGDGHPLGWT